MQPTGPLNDAAELTREARALVRDTGEAVAKAQRAVDAAPAALESAAWVVGAAMLVAMLGGIGGATALARLLRWARG